MLLLLFWYYNCHHHYHFMCPFIQLGFAFSWLVDVFKVLGYVFFCLFWFSDGVPVFTQCYEQTPRKIGFHEFTFCSFCFPMLLFRRLLFQVFPQFFCFLAFFAAVWSVWCDFHSADCFSSVFFNCLFLFGCSLSSLWFLFLDISLLKSVHPTSWGFFPLDYLWFIPLRALFSLSFWWLCSLL